MSGLMQHGAWSDAIITDLYFNFPNLTVSSSKCSSVVGQSFLVGTKVAGREESLVLNGYFKVFSNLFEIFSIIF